MSNRRNLLLIGGSALGLVGLSSIWQIADHESPNKFGDPSSNVPVFPLRRFPISGVPVDHLKISALLNDVLTCAFGQPTSGVILHVMKLFPVARWLRQPDFEGKISKFQEILLDDSIRHAKQGGLPLLLDTPYGARLRTDYSDPMLGHRTSSPVDTVAHRDQLLAILYCQNRTLDSFVITPSGRRLTTADILRDSIYSFRPHGELEWTLITFFGYVRAFCFENAMGARVSLLDLAKTLADQKIGVGSCFGTHRLKALAVCRQRLALEKNSTHQSARRRREIGRLLEYIDEVHRNIANVLIRKQHSDGSWNGSWHDSAPRRIENSQGSTLSSTRQISEQVLTTGHLLEWAALLPEIIRPPREAIRAALLYLQRTVLSDTWYFADQHLLASIHVLIALTELIEPLHSKGK